MANTYPSLFYGYTAIWFCVIIYLFLLARRLRRAEDSLAENTLREE